MWHSIWHFIWCRSCGAHAESSFFWVRVRSSHTVRARGWGSRRKRRMARCLIKILKPFPDRWGKIEKSPSRSQNVKSTYVVMYFFCFSTFWLFGFLLNASLLDDVFENCTSTINKRKRTKKLKSQLWCLNSKPKKKSQRSKTVWLSTFAFFVQMSFQMSFQLGECGDGRGECCPSAMSSANFPSCIT